MMNNLSTQKIEINYDSSNDEIDIKSFWRTLRRQKLILFSIPLLCSIISFVYAKRITPTYKGSFEIVVIDKNSDRTYSDNIVKALASNNSSTGETQELILKSPSVLMPVFEFVKNEYKKKGINLKSLTYKSWIKKDLKIKFKENSQVLSITNFNTDKKMIKETLELISKKYQNYSKKNKEREINNSINFLTTQKKIYEKKSTEARKLLNLFSIENGLGDVEGFVTLSQDANMEGKKGDVNAGQRFASQFSLLEKYESSYIDYSYKLKNNSEYLKNLKLKIENLRESLKRPNEILLKYRELKRKSFSSEITLAKIEEELNLQKLDQARQLNPWELISQPTIDTKKYKPHIALIMIRNLALSLFFGIILILLIEKIKGIIFEMNDIKKIINCEYLGSIYYQNQYLNLSKAKLKNLLKQYKIKKLGLAVFPKEENENIIFKNEIKNDKAFVITDLFSQTSISKAEKVLVIIASGKNTKNDLILLNQYIELNKDKVLGWFFLEETINK